MFRTSLIAALTLSATSISAAEFSSAELANGAIMVDSVSPNATYQTGSISKFACTLAILRLVDRGKVKLDDPIAAILPAFENAPAGPVSLRNILANRSGIADGLMPQLQSAPAQVMAVKSASKAAIAFASERAIADPGTEWSYDLVNWIIVQAVLEEVHGRPLAQTLRDLVLSPAGMGSSWVIEGSGDARLVEPSEPPRPFPSFLLCAGGLASTPADLIALARFPHQGGLSPASVEDLTTVTTGDQAYTLGGRYRSVDASRLLSWQTGSNGPYKSLVVYDPQSDRGFAAMTADGDDSAIQRARADWLDAVTVRQ